MTCMTPRDAISRKAGVRSKTVKPKQRIADLALFGGTPLFAEALHVGRPNIGDREGFLTRVNDLLDRRWLTNDGPLVRELEQRIAGALAVDHCVAVCNATLGLELLLRVLGLEGEVIVPSFTFIATAHAVRSVGLTPVFGDIREESHCLDPRKIESLISPRTSAILGVHLWGKACEAETLAEIAGRHGLAVVFDAAHAFGCSHDGRPIGRFGRAEVFSFHATKFLNTFEGGAITTNDGDLANRVRLMRNFGFSGYDRVVTHGTNAKMPEIAAAMGLSNLDVIDEIISLNRANYEQYSELLSGLPGFRILPYDLSEKNNFQYVVLEIEAEEAGLTRDHLIGLLAAENVLARRYFFPGCHRMEPYRTLCPEAARDLAVTERVAERVLQLPTGTTVRSDDIAAIAAALRLAVENAPAILRQCGGEPFPA